MLIFKRLQALLINRHPQLQRVKSNISPTGKLHLKPTMINCCRENLIHFLVMEHSASLWYLIRIQNVMSVNSKNTKLRWINPDKTILIDSFHTAHYSVTRGPLLSKGHELWMAPYGSPFSPQCSNYVKVEKNPICFFALLRNTKASEYTRQIQTLNLFVRS